MARNAVDLIVAGHLRTYRQGLHRLLERREEVLAKVAFAIRRRADIRTILWLAMAREVLQGDEHLVGRERQRRSLEPLDGRYAHLADEIRIIAIGLLDPSPARIARNVDDGGERQRRSASAHFARGNSEYAGEQRGVPGACEADRLREAGRSA